jgi:hypothetical protein
MKMSVGELMLLGLLTGLATFSVGMVWGIASVIRRRRVSTSAARLLPVGMAMIAATPTGAIVLGTDRGLPDPIWIALVVVSLSMTVLFLLIAAGLRVGDDRPG